VQDNSVPLVSGIPIENLQEGMRLPAKFHTLLEQISTIRNLSQRYFEAVSEIQVVPKQYGNYELVVYPTNARIRVLTDRSLTEDALKSMLVVLDVVKSIEPDVAEVDLRYDSLSYRCR
jgi:cell division protein FtsQ